MAKLVDSKETIAVLQRTNFQFKKQFGQNFLIDSSVLDHIISYAKIQKEDLVIEIGPGIGTLTEALCEHAGQVIAIEIDDKLIPILEENLAGKENFRLLHQDVLKVDFTELLKEYPSFSSVKVVANLPYYITTPILMDLLEKKLPLKSITVMVQKEVALRMKAAPGTKDYGALSLAVQYYSEPAIVQEVPPHCFIPRPNVSSSVIHLRLHKKAPVSVQDPALLFKTIKFSFMQRRKTLVNALASGFHLDKRQLQDLLSSLSYPENVRGETLSLADFSLISDGIREILSR
ncbi:16S rRNA (adenine(1518)-N(6)/adenine(1519)-N(6))-dimethyltransferase RsmA [Oribacterium sp. oral taxon 108]|uniref:16S rRNA (adenine(1518)-N(6)/adenine(1519)-N(6))- dimethyltransferase RsmA n=1 Tax=Oribacterium sp. oral taxon 108 TaxID=712414 RepID=UPI00020DD14D|nr:16S rRNA (adenine(1518)-N(6)/adenine(1519)-N(6))-dimethyltransferase RsmA [Oribacterium sp. oral taxon 108]EGL36741.1 dimethyladenosine transferase [Oribacterium sp. oral taxon 108 str. F0425]